MAKKPAMISFKIKFECEIEVPAENKKDFEKDLKREELSLSAQLEVGDNTHFFNIYPDHITGSIHFKKLNDHRYSVSADGTYTTEDSDILSEVKKLKTPPSLMLTDVSDSNPNSYYVNGDENHTIEIGTIVL